MIKNCEPLVSGPAVGHRQTSGLIESEVGTEFVFEAVSRIARSGAHGIAALDHEVGDHAMEDGAVIERHTVHRLAGLGIFPVFGSGRQTDEVGHGERRFVGEERAGDVAGRGLEDGSGLLDGLSVLLRRPRAAAR